MTGRPRASSLHPGFLGAADLAAAFAVTRVTVWRWHRRHGIGHRAGPSTARRPDDIVFTNRDIVAAGALALLGTKAEGWPTPAKRALAAEVVRAVKAEPGRFVVATPERAVTLDTAERVVAWLGYLDEAVVTVVDLDRAAPIARAALARLTVEVIR